MAPKTNCNAQKLNTIQSWFRKSRSVWSIKELEKQLPSVSSINGMQVKDYVQTLHDDNKISCEKIGSGNWYWAFQSQRAKTTQDKLAAAHAEYEKIAATVEDFKRRLDVRAAEIQEEMDAAAASAAAAAAAAADEQEGGKGATESRETLQSRSGQLEKEVCGMKQELEAYSGEDPTALQKMQEGVCGDYAMAEMFTEDIYSMESWFKKQGAEELVGTFPETVYGEEWSAEDATLLAHDPLESWFFE
ncbi:hypothetical protein CERZMDRAFT_84467 [Cercospora zeae-maydis SCOH1-5]|uniref:Mnd1 HTH domain-containing protein n=1 Tax=Cercospora zeae-maydis SCOH1-5 TaxID=717836 RepID=A0A6A6FHA6_9PEZI|nr:hypothetical protein CERZMDRAFT_84467 [Cercospora zeae-maydis SCOH1-5]